MVSKSYKSLEQATKIISGASNKTPFIVNVNSSEQYKEVYSKFKHLETIRLSSYIVADNPHPCLQNLNSAVSNSAKPALVLGFTQYLAFIGKEKPIEDFLIKTINETNKIIILTFNLENLLVKLAKDPRIEKNILFIESSRAVEHPKITISQGAKDSLRIFFETLETEGLHIGRVNDVDVKSFKDGIWSVRAESNYDILINSGIFAGVSVEEEFGTNEQWEFLNGLLSNKHGTSTLQSAYLSLFVKQTIESILKNYDKLDSDQKWFLWLCSRHATENKYLSFALEKTKCSTDFLPSIYEAILDVNFKDKRFAGFYKERKELLCALIKSKDHIKLLKSYIEQVVAMSSADKAYYLTDLTPTERETLIRTIVENRYSPTDLRKILSHADSKLSAYMSSWTSDNEQIDNYVSAYFDEGGYKYHKLTNQVTNNFLQTVDSNARERQYNKLLDTTAQVFSSINKDKSKVYFIDSLGFEFVGYIVNRTSELGIDSKVTPARCNLPSSTEFNKQFLSDYKVGEKNYVEKEYLDKLKHGKNKDATFSKTDLPIHLLSELDIIDKIIENIARDLASSSFDKVLIVTDHGSSRLFVLARNSGVSSLVVQASGGSGRFLTHDTYKILNINESHKASITIEDEHAIIASYNYFNKQSLGVEAHGGATVEEVVVPVIEFTLQKAVSLHTQIKKEDKQPKGEKSAAKIVDLGI
ncbi:MAG: BREX-4 system phosphatase PglZ [Firmicutes bacterium]|nr:BREX-4 system phosphatase PglZ [Bacillota bacterium]